jgi:hypothetical protein
MDAGKNNKEIVDELVSLLGNSREAMSPSEFRLLAGSGLKVPGLYSWWIDETGAVELSSGLGFEISAGLIYVGLAGATHWPSGKRSSNTLWLRINNMHLGRNHEFSTFRRSIGAVLAYSQGMNFVDEEALTSWMETHLRVVAIPYHDADTLGRVEENVLETMDPPLNLKGRPTSNIRKRLKELRKIVSQ